MTLPALTLALPLAGLYTRILRADVAVTMGCGDECPLVLARRRVDWKIPDPRDMTPEAFREVRDLIGRKVQDLLAELDAEPSGGARDDS